MPKLLVLALIIPFFLILAGNFFDRPLLTPPASLPSLSPSPTSAPPPAEISLNNHLYRYYYRQIQPHESLALIPNFTSAQTSKNLIDSNKCTFGINGGFYRTDNRPLGLFYADGQIYNSAADSLTFNGYLAQNSDDGLSIDSIQTLDPSTLGNRLQSGYYNFIFQSGPLFNLSAPTPEFSDPEYARRHLIAQDSQNRFYIFSVFEKENRYGGPRLEDIPNFFNHPQIQKIAPFTSVLNLDGGSASAFFDGQNKVEELTFIGSFLCGR